MSNRYFTIYSESFSNYAEREIGRSNATQRANLNDRESKILTSESTIRRFCHDDTLEHILYILTKLGKHWDIRVYDQEETADQLEFNIVNQFQFPEKRIENIEAQAKNNIHYLSSTDVALSAGMAAQNSMTRIYELSTGSITAISKTRNWSKLREPYNELIGKARDAADQETTYLVNQLNATDYVKKTLDLQLNELRVLGALFEKKDGAMVSKEISVRVALTQKVLVKVLNDLVSKKVIMHDGKHGIKVRQHTLYYMITQEGVERIMKYRNYVHKLTLGV